MNIKMNLGKNSYDINIKRGGLNEVETFFNLDRNVMIITDDGVPEVYAELVAKKTKNPQIFTIKQGEFNKSLSNFEEICKNMLASNFTRKDCVVAVGGGVVGDLAGFVAASYMRGVDFYNIPTTLLSQVDSSIGGKVAVNLNGIKNIIGAFYQPKAVLIDPEVLKTLPKRQISNGLAEALKMSLTSDKELFEIFENKDIDNCIDEIIYRSLTIKKNVVEKDEREDGIRKILNFGHTVGHAVEALSLSNLYHGECVSIGMLPFCSNSVKCRLIPILKKLNLPYEFNFDKSDILPILRHDKKSNNELITAVFVNEIGSFELKNITFEEIMDLL